MTEQNVERLREQLRIRGYLSHGFERWFALDPWSSRTFWAELLLITTKAATIASPFAALPAAAVMLIRNGPLPPYETLLLVLVYLVSSFVLIAAIVLATAALMKLRPRAVIERPEALMLVSLAESALVVAALVGWWLAFPVPPRPVEIVIMLALLLLFLPIGTLAFSAALLSFSIYETREVPSFHRKPRTVPLTIAGAAMLVLLLLLVPGTPPVAGAGEPVQIVIKPNEVRVALLAVDGLSQNIFAARSTSLQHPMSFRETVRGSAAEVWATIGTGTNPELHRVRSIEAARLAGSERLLQELSAADFVLTALTRQQPLPPTARERHYVWEILGERGVDSLAINWWATSDQTEPNLRVISQESVYAAATPTNSPLELALNIDRVALEFLNQATSNPRLRLGSAYCPALDVILNRLDLDGSERLAASVRALDQLDAVIYKLRESGWIVVLVGTDFTASSLALNRSGEAIDIAPTILDLFGFPASTEMRGTSRLPASKQLRIRTFGPRLASGPSQVDPDYYQKLRSLGYIR